jgi:hypothetical protein
MLSHTFLEELKKGLVTWYMRGEVKAEAVPRSGERVHWNDPIATAFRVYYPSSCQLPILRILAPTW